MNVTVGTTPVELPETGRGRPVVQNLGPGTVYLEEHSGVSATNGFQLAVGSVYEFPLPPEDPVWMVADAAGTDVRYLVVS